MDVNLNVTLNAYPSLTSTVLKDYVTKEELEDKAYVNTATLHDTLGNYTRDVVDAEEGKIYGRQELNGVKAWVPFDN